MGEFTVKELTAFLDKVAPGATDKGDRKKDLAGKVKAILLVSETFPNTHNASRVVEILQHRVSRFSEDVNVEDRVETHRVDRAELLVRYEAWIPLEQLCATDFEHVDAYLQPIATQLDASHPTLFKRGTLQSGDGVKHEAYVVAHDLDDSIIQCPYVIATSDDDKGDYTQEEVDAFLSTGNLKI